MAKPVSANRGPAAAAENRRALLRAARRVFATRGLDVPFSAIARDAGVGQAVLYRHFPDRLSLGFAIFEENLAELEKIGAADDDDQTFGRLWARILELTIKDAAFVQVFVAASRADADYDGGERFLALLRRPLVRAQAAGLVDPALTAEEVLLVQRMIYGVVATSLGESDTQQAVGRALSILAPTGQWSTPPGPSSGRST